MASKNHKEFLTDLFFDISQNSRFEWSNIKDFPSHLITNNFNTSTNTSTNNNTENSNIIIIVKIPRINNGESNYGYLYTSESDYNTKEQPFTTFDEESCKNLILWYLNEYGIPTRCNWWYHPYP